MIFVRYFLINEALCPFVWFTKISNVYLLYSFIHVFIHNSITKYYWQKFFQTFDKNVYKTFIVCVKVNLWVK